MDVLSVRVNCRPSYCFALLYLNFFFHCQACLALATARLGSTGAWQNGILYITYTASALLGATYVVKCNGARTSLTAAMALYCVYVVCFWAATLQPNDSASQRMFAWTG